MIGVGLVRGAQREHVPRSPSGSGRDDAVRSAVVAQADATRVLATTRPATPTPVPGEELTVAARQLRQAADDVKRGRSGHRVSHSAGARKDWPHGVWLGLLGWLVTILAISLGAPFWFDALGRLSRLRSSGKPETPLPATGSGKSNERILTSPQKV